MSLLDLIRPWRVEDPEPEEEETNQQYLHAWAERRVASDLEMEWRSGVRQVRAKPLVWTTTVPTVPGHYWWRDPSNPGTPKVFELTVGYRCAAVGLQFAGPICPPYEPRGVA